MSSNHSSPPEANKQSNILDFSAFKKKKDSNSEFSRSRKPLFVNQDKGQISGAMDSTKAAQANEDFGDRLQKIRSSLERINTLMADLKKLSSNRDKDHIN